MRCRGCAHHRQTNGGSCSQSAPATEHCSRRLHVPSHSASCLTSPPRTRALHATWPSAWCTQSLHTLHPSTLLALSTLHPSTRTLCARTGVPMVVCMLFELSPHALAKPKSHSFTRGGTKAVSRSVLSNLRSLGKAERWGQGAAARQVLSHCSPCQQARAAASAAAVDVCMTPPPSPPFPFNAHRCATPWLWQYLTASTNWRK